MTVDELATEWDDNMDASDLPDLDMTKAPYMPFHVHDFRDSEFVLTTNAEEFRAAIFLWAASWHQKPCGTLPSNDSMLAQMSGFGRDIASWLAVKDGALYGFQFSQKDDRYHHPYIRLRAMEVSSKLRSDVKLTKRRLRVAHHRRSKIFPYGQNQACDYCGNLGGMADIIWPGRVAEFRKLIFRLANKQLEDLPMDTRFLLTLASCEKCLKSRKGRPLSEFLSDSPIGEERVMGLVNHFKVSRFLRLSAAGKLEDDLNVERLRSILGCGSSPDPTRGESPESVASSLTRAPAVASSSAPPVASASAPPVVGSSDSHHVSIDGVEGSAKKVKDSSVSDPMKRASVTLEDLENSENPAELIFHYWYQQLKFEGRNFSVKRQEWIQKGLENFTGLECGLAIKGCENTDFGVSRKITDRTRERKMHGLHIIFADEAQTRWFIESARSPEPVKYESLSKGGQDDVNVVFEHWKAVFSRPRASLDQERISWLRQALEIKTVEECCDAVTGCSLTPFNMGENPQEKEYVELHVIFKSAAQIERFIRHKEKPPKPRTTKGDELVAQNRQRLAVILGDMRGNDDNVINMNREAGEFRGGSV